MKYLDVLMEEVTKEEGQNNFAYQDSEGFWTVGIGHLLNEQDDAELAILGLEDEPESWDGFVITDTQCYELLRHDINETYQRLLISFSESELEALDSKRFLSVFNMAYQLGSVSGFPSFVKAVKAGDYDRASKEMLFRDGSVCKVNSRWYKQTPKRCQRMADLMLMGSEPMDTGLDSFCLLYTSPSPRDS